MGASTQVLLEHLRSYVDTGFNVGVGQFERMTRAENLPRDTGGLIAGIRVRSESGRATIRTAEVRSTARAAGADYPAILENAPRIAPRKARLLHFFVHGREVFSRGFANTHFKWWSRTVVGDKGQRRWTDALRRGFGAAR